MLRAMLVAGLCIAGCTAPGSSLVPIDTSDPQGSWILISGGTDAGDIPIVDDHPITLTIEGRAISGTAACNGYGGRLEPTAEGVRVVELGQTDMACMPDEVMEAETAFTQALIAVRAIRLDDAQLVLEGIGLEMRFDPLPAPPTAELVGTTWTLETLLLDDMAAAPMGEPATLELRADGTFSGTTGCRPFDGQWIESGEQLLATTFAMGDVACPAELADQDSHVVSVIGDGFVPSIKDGLLTLSDPGGMGLVYRSGE